MAALIQLQDGAGGLRTEIPLPACRIGRGGDNHICIDDDLVSREHAVVERVRGEADPDSVHYIIRDLGSTNGTFVNHERVDTQVLSSGDTIRIGKSFFRFAEDGDDPFGDTVMLKKTFIPGVFVTREKEKKK